MTRSCKTGNKFYIIGPRRLQNELIASHLERETGNVCHVLENVNQIPKDNPKSSAQPSLVLWDCVEKDLKKLLSELKTYGSQKKSANRIVFFNVSADMEFRKKFVLKGIYGFFMNMIRLIFSLKGYGQSLMENYGFPEM